MTQNFRSDIGLLRELHSWKKLYKDAIENKKKYEIHDPEVHNLERKSNINKHTQVYIQLNIELIDLKKYLVLGRNI